MAKKISNTAAGPRGVLLADGTTHYVEPGQTVSLDVAKDHELYNGLVEGGLPDAPAEDGPKPLAKMNKGELLEVATDAGVTEATDKDGKTVPVGEATNAQIVEAIEAKRSAA